MNERKNKINARLVFNVLAILFLIFMVVAIFFPQFGCRNHRGEFQMKCWLELVSLGTALEAYQSKYLIFPEGSAVEIVKALLGDNPEKIKFLDVRASDLSPAGEFLDPWKTPFTINFSPTKSFVLSSAGKDNIWGNKDDIIFKSGSKDFNTFTP